MEIKKELLEAKLQEYTNAIAQYRALADANQGAAQATQELLNVINAPAPEDPPEK